MTCTIIDVSRAQGQIVWQVLAASGRVDGAVMKATEGNGPYVDPEFTTNFAQAHACGLLLGTYHFAHPDESDDDAAIEARHYVTIVQAAARKHGVTQPLLYGLDVEEARKIRKGPTFVAWCRKFVETVESMTGLVCWIYTGGPFWNDADGDISVEDAAFFAARPLWLAAYVNDPTKYVAMTPWVHVGLTMHQKSGDVGPGNTAGVRYPGITANVVDTNVFGGTITALRALIATPAPSLAPTLPAPGPTKPETPTALGAVTLEITPVPHSIPLFERTEGQHTPIHLRNDDDGEDPPPEAA